MAVSFFERFCPTPFSPVSVGLLVKKKKRMLTFLFFKLEESFVSKVVLIDQVKKKGNEVRQS